MTDLRPIDRLDLLQPLGRPTPTVNQLPPLAHPWETRTVAGGTTNALVNYCDAPSNTMLFNAATLTAGR